MAQQPTKKTPTPTPTTPTTSPEGPNTKNITPEQAREILEKSQKDKTAEQQEGQTDEASAESTNEEGEPEKRKKEPKGVADTLDLPIFGNDIFNNTTSTFAPAANRPTPVGYVLGAGDRLSIDVTGNSVVSWSLTVSPDGSILLPGIGKVYLGGKTIENATEAIKNKLRSNRYAIGNGTDVSVTLINIRSMKITVMGEVRNPGDYNVSAFTTVFNALYESGGITSVGSFRAIEVIRNSEQIARVDMYDYLLRGDLSSNIQLRDGDIIRVPEYRVRVSIKGEVKRPAYYEVMPGEALRDIVIFSGGFSDYAYKFNIKAIQLTDREQRIRDIPAKEIDSYIPLKGDKYFVDRILDRYENRVSIAGAIYRPGDYELSDGLTLKELIAKADGLKEDAYMERGYITRLKDDNSTEVIPFYTKAIVDGINDDIILRKEDVITISSVFDYTDAYTVTVNGKVRAGGNFPYFNGMTVEDLILKGGGFADGANIHRVEIARRVKDSDRKSRSAALAEIINITIDPELKLAESKFKLEPFDVVSVFALPGFVTPQIVTITGEVMNPGSYAMRTKDERISDLIERAGGFTAYAYLKGASLKRGDLVETESDAEKQQMKITQFSQKQMEATDGKSEVNLTNPTKRNNFVDIDLSGILNNPKRRNDLILLNGDVLSVPRELQTVKVTGEVYSPTTTVYNPSQGLNEYVLRSGGYTEDAFRRKPYVIYANGSIKGTKRFLFIKNYPRIEPGAEIFIPKRKPRRDVSGTAVAQTWIGITSSLASVAAVIFGVVTVAKNN